MGKFPKSKEIKLVFGLFVPLEKIIFSFAGLVLTISLIAVIWILNGKFSVEKPIIGGTLKEGAVGAPNLINPILASSDLDQDLSALIYSGLMRSDGKGGLKLDLAKDYNISENGLEYVFYLKEDLRWHDGKSLTSEDVVFTINSLKNPELKSPLRPNWEGVEAEAVGGNAVKFVLSRPYQPFIENTILGILPKHIWEKIPASQWRMANLNLKPIGAGPYKIEKIVEDDSGIILAYYLEHNKKYQPRGPYLKNLIFKIYPSESELLKAFSNKEIESFGGVNQTGVNKVKIKENEIKILAFPKIFALFFNQNRARVFAEKEVRLALETALDKEKIVNEVLSGYGRIANTPVANGSFDLSDNVKSEDRIRKAKEILAKAGFKLNEKTGILEKKTGKKESIALNFSISTCECEDLIKAAEILKDVWSQIGAKVEIKIFTAGNLNQNVIRTRNYEALLFGEFIGRKPDLFPFWHSSQRFDPGLNVALYANAKVDSLLEKIREERDSEKREQYFLEFKKEIKNDIPAIFLYSPSYIYVLPEKIKNFEAEKINIPAERFSNIEKWHAETQKILKIFN